MQVGKTVFHHRPTGKPIQLKIIRETPKQWVCNDGKRFWKKNNKAVGYPWPMLGSFISEN